jgi:hypothetical protein
MSISLEQLTQILAKVRISSSLEEEILTTAESLITPPEANDETTYKEPCTSDDEQLCEQEIEEDNKELRHDLRSENYAYESIIERWFQAGTRLDPFNFSFYFVKLQFQHLISHGYIYFRLSFAKFTVNIFLLLLRLWLHWKFDYT